MRRLTGALLALALAAAAPGPAHAEENDDLERIPGAIEDPSRADPAGGVAPTASLGQRRLRLHLEDAAVLALLRRPIVGFPPPAPPDWQNRTSFDGSNQWDLADGLTASLSDRLTWRETSDFGLGARRSARNDFREGYLTWEPAGTVYLEAGRINLRNGIALGFNPTDFFKARTQVDQASLDPSAQSRNRLGTLMARAQGIWEAGSLSVAVAPGLYSPSPLAAMRSAFDPGFERTNAADRLLLSASHDLAGLNPQLLAYREGADMKTGLNLSRQLGQSVIAYAEWAGGSERPLIAEALAYGRRTGTLPASAPTLPPTTFDKRFRNDLALGASWASALGFTTNLEYHYHQAGFSDADWRNWFAIGRARPGVPQVASELWYVRAFAADRQQPLTRQQMFLRANMPDAFWRGLELTALAFVDLTDGSSLAQLSASYYLTNAWTIGAYVSANLGSPRSERGSLPQAASAILQLVRYF
ncbi:MAG: hypothetical protein HYR63_22560 [Proteobacteria bacterium]|nr:hypothetical protein [Pseudomonadota bacterium]MBI3497632.1 hypothetical protein [Pseudomonadota bacterium]